MPASRPPAQPSPFADAADLTPVFIVGMPRSGTTLVDQILTGHPEADGVGELAFFDQAATAFYQGGLDQPLPAGCGTTICAAWPRPATVVSNKYPANFRHLSLLRWLLPEARFVHVRRSALDTCLSVYFQDFPYRQSVCQRPGGHRRLLPGLSAPDGALGRCRGCDGAVLRGTAGRPGRCQPPAGGVSAAWAGNDAWTSPVTPARSAP